MTLINQPSNSDNDDDFNPLPITPTIAHFPAPIQEHLLDTHYTGVSKGSAMNVRIPQQMEREMDLLLAHLDKMGGLEWIKTRSDLIRMGMYLLIKQMVHYLEDPPPELIALVTMEDIEAKAVTQNMLEQKLERSVKMRSQQMASMLQDPSTIGQAEVVMRDFVGEFLSIPDAFWRRRYAKAVLDDGVLSKAARRFGMIGELEAVS